MTELFTVLENGQLEVNFESLELKTSTEFVTKVKKYLDRSPKRILKNIEENDVCISVFCMYSDSVLREFIFHKRDGYMDEISISYSDVKKYIEYGGAI